jgi:hypothetical protein
MGRGATDPQGTTAEALASGVSRRTAQRRRRARLEAGEPSLVPVELPGFSFPANRRILPRQGAAVAAGVEGAIVARLREAIEAGDAPAIKIYTSAWMDACKCLKVWEEWARAKDAKDEQEAWAEEMDSKMNLNFL